MNWVKVGLLEGIKPLLENRFGISTQKMRSDISTTFFTIDDPDTKCSLEEVIKILELCAHYTNCGHFGLLLADAQKQYIETFGVVGLLGQHSTNLEEALAQTLKHQQCNVKGIDWTMSKHSGYVHLILSCNENSDLCIRQTYAYTMAKVFTLLTYITAQQWQPAQVFFNFQKPDELTPWRDFFGKNVFFDREYNGFIFDKNLLHLPIVHKNRQLLSIIKDYLKLSGQSSSHDKIEQIRSQMRSMLLLNQDCTLQKIAASQNKSVRALQYYLQQHDLTYQELLVDVRYSLAKELLSLSEHRISEISTIVGFSDTAVFSRSFKNNVGMTPTQYRKKSSR